MSCSVEYNPVARKQHRCLWCGETIVVGEKYVMACVSDGNQHWRHRYHDECRVAMHNAMAYDYTTIDWWNDEGCVPKFERGHIHEVGSDTREAEAERGCHACRALLRAAAEEVTK